MKRSSAGTRRRVFGLAVRSVSVSLQMVQSFASLLWCQNPDCSGFGALRRALFSAENGECRQIRAASFNESRP
jgi:hypothetical protein